MGFSRQEYWSGLPFHSPGDLPNPGIEPGSPALQADALPSEPPNDTHLEFIFDSSLIRHVYVVDSLGFSLKISLMSDLSVPIATPLAPLALN